MAGILFLLGSIVGAWLTSTALRRFRANRVGPWPLALVAGEMPLHHILWQAVLSALWIWLGALETWPGRVALVLTILSWLGLMVLWWWSFHARPAVDGALSEALGDDFHRTPRWFADPVAPPGAADPEIAEGRRPPFRALVWFGAASGS